MITPVEKRFGKFTVFYFSRALDPGPFLKALFQSRLLSNKGRAGIRVFEMDGFKLAARKYTHGGLFRAFTGDLFLGKERVKAEADVLAHLQEKKFPAVAPFAAITEQRCVFTRLHLVTAFQENAISLLDYLRHSNEKQRLRTAKKLAELLWRMEKAGVYHPDFHLRNILVTPEGNLVFLDFDRARIRNITERETIKLIHRLDRFADKMERQGLLHIQMRQKALFLRIYSRLSGKAIVRRMESGTTRRRLLHRVGWMMESILYGNNV